MARGRGLVLVFVAAAACSVPVLCLLLSGGLSVPSTPSLNSRQSAQSRSQYSLDSDIHSEINTPPSIPAKLSSLPQDVLDGVEKFVFFVGYSRSGHSIIGSMMDAHPDMVIAHEFMLFKKWLSQPMLKSKENLFNALYRDSLLDATEGMRTEDKDSKGYTLQMEQSWQGRFRTLRVIGDKSGGMVAKLYTKDPEDVRRTYLEIADTVGIPIRVLHVVRNPYDIIATQLLFNGSSVMGQKVKATVDHPYNNTAGLMLKAHVLFRRASSVMAMLKEWNLDVLEVHSADHVRDPKGTMQRICNFLEVECPDDYLQQCYDKTFKTLSRSRELVVWSEETLKMVEECRRKFPFFLRYSYEKDY